MVEAIIFDLDGVVVDPSSSPKRKCEKRALREFGIEPSDNKFSSFKGLSPREKITSIVKNSEIEVNPEKIIERKLELHLKQLESVREVEGAKECVDEVSDNYKTAVASNSEKVVVERAVKNLGLEENFDILVSSDDVEQGKPDPEIFLKAAEELGTKPSETVVIDDSEVGVKGAKQGDFIPVGFRLPKEDLKHNIENLYEFSDFLKEIDDRD